MDSIKPLPVKKVIKALEDIGKGMICKIINDAKITRDEWLDIVDSL